MDWRSVPLLFVTSGAMTLTICARQATRTRSDWRMSVLRKPPVSSASSRL